MYLQVDVTFSLPVRSVMEKSSGVPGAAFVCRLSKQSSKWRKMRLLVFGSVSP